MTQDEKWEIVQNNEDPSITNIEPENGGGWCATVYTWGDYDGHKERCNIIAAAPEMLAEMEKLAQALEDTGHEPPQSFYDVIKKARGL